MSSSDMNTEDDAKLNRDFSVLLVSLLKGIVYRDDNQALWVSLLTLQPRVRDYLAVLALDLILDEAEGYAFLRSQKQDDEDAKSAIPRLVTRRQLSYPVSLMLALLRKKLAEFDASGAETRLILSQDEMVELIRIFLPAGSNEVKLSNQIAATLKKIAELGFIRLLAGEGKNYEVRRIIKAFVDAQCLTDYNERLAVYRQLHGGAAEAEDEDA